jgi:hypothetical protein
MGLLDAISRFLGTPQDVAKRIAQLLGGTVHQRDDKLQIVGERNGYSVRITLDEGNPTVEVKLKTEVNVFNLTLRYDAEAAKQAKVQLDRTEWDDADNADQKLFLSPHVYLEAGRDDLRRYRTFLEQMPDNLLARLLELLESKSNAVLTVRFFWIFRDKVQLMFNDSRLVMGKDGPEQMAWVLDLLTSLAAAAERDLT